MLINWIISLLYLILPALLFHNKDNWMNSADDGSRGVFCQLKSLTQGLWDSPCSLKVFFGIIHRCVFAPENPAKRKQPRSNTRECGVRFPVWISLSTLLLILVCSSTQNCRNWSEWDGRWALKEGQGFVFHALQCFPPTASQSNT